MNGLRNVCAYAGVVLAMGCGGRLVQTEEGEATPIGEQQAALYLNTTSATWVANGNYIPVCWHNADGLGLYPERALAQAAIDRTWGANANLHIDWRGTCPTDDSQGRFMMFGITRSTNGVSSGVTYGYGMDTFRYPSSGNPGPRIWMTTDVTLGRLEYLAVHEFGHALGFVHEQDRPEPEAAQCRDGGTGAPGTVLTPYDRDSVMNYCNSCNNQCGTLTDLDKKGIAKVYGYPRSNAAPTRSRKPAAGSFTTARSEIGRTAVAYVLPAANPGSIAFWCFVGPNNDCQTSAEYGWFGDIPVPGDYDGDGLTDVAFWRPSDHKWYVTPSSGVEWTPIAWGDPGDYPVPADYDGDGKADIAVWRPKEGNWYVRNSQSGNPTTVTLGAAGDVPVPGDYDGDGHVDRATWRPLDGYWRIGSWNGTVSNVVFGLFTDVPVPGDYDGDGKVDTALWRQSDHKWIVINSNNKAQTELLWGDPGDAPVPGDYDRDGKTDAAVWRPSDRNWYIRNSGNNPVSTTWFGIGQQGMIPLPR